MNVPTDWTLNLVERPNTSVSRDTPRRPQWLSEARALLKKRPMRWTVATTLIIIIALAVGVSVAFMLREESPSAKAPDVAEASPTSETAGPVPPSQPVQPSTANTGTTSTHDVPAPATHHVYFSPVELLQEHQMHLTFLAYDGQNQNADARVRMALTVRDAERWDAFAAAMGNTLETTSIEATDGTSAVTIAGRTPAHHWFNLGTDDATDQPTDERGTTATSSSLYATLIKHGKVISLASGDATNEGLNVAGSGRSGSVLDFIEALHGHPTYRWLEWALEPTGHPGHLSFTGRIALRTQDPPAPIDVRDVPWAEPSQVSAPTKTAATPPQHLHVRAWADGPQASVLLVNTQTNQSLLAVGRNHSQEADAILLELQPHYASVELNGTVHILDLP